MKPDSQVKQYASTVVGDDVKLSIDESATAHLMDVLTKLYADTEKAIIREYSTNALDSHIEAGVNRPIEVTLPSSLSPFLTIRDYGIGLDADGIRNIYSRYGTSTKRGSNDAVGMLGLGCKSALAYTDQFTLTGFKDGVRTEVLISRDEDGAGTMTIVAADSTTEGNGVKVLIPIKRDNDVERKAREFFSFWKPGTVTLNPDEYGHGEEPQRIGTTPQDEETGHIWLNDNILLTTDVNESIVVMGNVPYPLYDDAEPLFKTGNSARRFNSRTSRWEYGEQWNAVCFVDIGAVNFVPSREALMDTKRTKAALETMRTTISDLRDQAIRDQIANAPTAREAQELLKSGMSMGFDKADAKWKGRDVLLHLSRNKRIEVTMPDGSKVEQNANGYPDDWPVEDALKYSYLFSRQNRYSRKAGERGHTLALDSPQLVFEGFDGKNLTNVKRAKLELWCQNEGIAFSQPMIFVDKLNADEKFWTSGWDVYQWTDVSTLELPKQTMPDGTTTRLKGSYDAWISGDRKQGISAAAIADEAKTTPLLWMNGNMWSVQSCYEVRSGAVDFKNAIIVCLGANRVDKFCRDFPNAKKVSVAAQEAAERWRKTIPTQVFDALALNEKRTVPDYLDPAKLDDPELQRAVELSRVDTSIYTNAESRYRRWIPAIPASKAATKAAAVLDKYPLLGMLNWSAEKHAEHVHLYINAAYAAGKGA